MASCTISPGQEVTDIYSQCYYDQARADRAAKCAEYRSGVHYRVCRVISLPGVQRTVQVVSCYQYRVYSTAVPCYHYRVCSTGCVVLSLQGVPCCRFRCCCPACEGHWPLLHCLPGSLQDTPQSNLMDNVPRSLLCVMVLIRAANEGPHEG